MFKIVYLYGMLKHKNRIFAVVLLLSFTALLLPKSWWHDCDHGVQHAAVHKNEQGKQIKQGYEKCAACDLQMPLLHEPERPLVVTLIPSEFVKHVVAFEGALHAIQLSVQSRGPPVEMT